jgi:hypothetical protein
MNLLDELNKVDKIFIDTAPIIYYIEKHLQFGPLVMEVVKAFQSGKVEAFTSAITGSVLLIV